MKKDNKILSALLDHLISSSEDGEADELGKWDSKCKDPEVKVDTDDIDEGDEESKKMKKFLAALKD